MTNPYAAPTTSEVSPPPDAPVIRTPQGIGVLPGVTLPLVCTACAREEGVVRSRRTFHSMRFAVIIVIGLLAPWVRRALLGDWPPPWALPTVAFQSAVLAGMLFSARGQGVELPLCPRCLLRQRAGNTLQLIGVGLALAAPILLALLGGRVARGLLPYAFGPFSGLGLVFLFAGLIPAELSFAVRGWRVRDGRVWFSKLPESVAEAWLRVEAGGQ